MYFNCHSWFSFHYGTLSVEALLREAQRLGIRKLALTDINNTSGILEFARLAPAYGVEPVAGVEFREGEQLRFIAVAHNNEGFREINLFLSVCLKEAALRGEAATKGAAVVPLRAPAFKNASVIYPGLTPAFLMKESAGESRHSKIHEPHNVLRADEYIGVRPQDLPRFAFSSWNLHPEKCIALWPVTLSEESTSMSIHRLLRAMGQNTLLTKVQPAHLAQPTELFTPEATATQRYQQYPFLLKNATALMEQSNIRFEFHKSKNLKVFSGSAAEDEELLRTETWKGVRYRYGDSWSDDIQQRVEKELRMICQQEFCAYFLINWDIVNYARSKSYAYVGRGSGANSIVAYCLRITDVDPVDLDLYFERFINPYRVNPPDFDLDFSWKDRDDVLAYIFRRYGEDRTALLATYSTYQSNAVVRELGKVFGLPPAEIDALQAMPEDLPAPDNITRLIRRYSALLQDFPNHLSIHAGGVLISEEPIASYTAISSPPKGFPLTQFSMLEAEDVGLYKFDILSQRGLGHIRDTVELVKQNRGIDIDIHDVQRLKEDEKIKTLIRDGRCMGCFYVESPAMRMLLKKLQVDTYLQLVAASSIIRPGVARSGMMREYIARTHDEARRTYIHPVMKELMEETYGVMVYQEDVIKVAHHFAGLGLSEADMLRRGMSGKFRGRSEFQKIRDKFFSNCEERGYPAEITAEVWRQIESFAGYSFSKGHSASYAVESYQSLFLKAYYPLEFMVGVINNFGGFYRTEFYVHEARMSGAVIHAPDINRSQFLTSISGKEIFLGFIHLNGIEEQTAMRILNDRNVRGPFASLDEFMKRVPVTLEQLRILIRIDAFRFTGRSRKQLMWDIHLRLGQQKRTVVTQTLFDEPVAEWKLPELHEDPMDDVMDEMDLLGFTLRSPFDIHETATDSLNGKHYSFSGTLTAKQLADHIGEEVEIYGYLVTTKPTRTVKGETMAFGCFLDHKGFFFDTTHFPKLIKQFPFRGRGIYKITGKVDEEFGFCSLTVTAMEKLPTHVTEASLQS